VSYIDVPDGLTDRRTIVNYYLYLHKNHDFTCFLYGCETWFLILTEEHRLNVYEIRLLRIFWHKRKEVTGGCRRLQIWKLYELYASPNIIRVINSRRIWWAWHVARVGEMRCGYIILVGKAKETRSLGRPWRRWENSIGINLRDTGWEGVDLTHLA